MPGFWKGSRHTEEAKRKMARAKRGRPNVAWIGRKHSEETKMKMRAAALGRKHSEASKLKMSIAKLALRLPFARRHNLRTVT